MSEPKPILPGVFLLWVPELNRKIRVKVDTGAANSSIHMTSAVGLPITGHTNIVSSSGKQPIVLQTELTILGRKHKVNLTDRSKLRCEMIIGCSALAGYLIDPDWHERVRVYGT